MAPCDCSCPQCRSMCANSTCLPTPEEAAALIRAGYADRLAGYVFAQPAVAVVGPAPRGMGGREGLPHTRIGPCEFFDGNRCELHDAGLKPLEGRLARHDRHWLPIRKQVIAAWVQGAADSRPLSRSSTS